MHTQFIQTLENNYANVFNYTGGQPSLRLVASLAAQYTFAGRMYSGVAHQAVMDRMESEDPSFRVFRPCRKNIGLYYKIATYLALHGSMEECALKVEEKDALLGGHGFARSPYRVVGAFFLEDKAHAGRAKRLYDEMDKLHPILTRKSDIPLAVLVTANGDENTPVQARTMHGYFKELRKRGFKAGDSLQTLTQILAIYDIHFHMELAEYAAQLKIELENKGIHIKRLHYPFIGILALAAADLQVVGEVVLLEGLLRETKALRRVKELALIIAIQKLVRDYTEVQESIGATSIMPWQVLYEMGDFFLSFPPGIPEGLSDLIGIDLNF
ncbi:MAG: DUF4003 family protein [Lysinibacillus sp.]